MSSRTLPPPVRHATVSPLDARRPRSARTGRCTGRCRRDVRGFSRNARFTSARALSRTLFTVCLPLAFVPGCWQLLSISGVCSGAIGCASLRLRNGTLDTKRRSVLPSCSHGVVLWGTIRGRVVHTTDLLSTSTSVSVSGRAAALAVPLASRRSPALAALGGIEAGEGFLDDLMVSLRI